MFRWRDVFGAIVIGFDVWWSLNAPDSGTRLIFAFLASGLSIITALTLVSRSEQMIPDWAKDYFE